MLNEMRVIAVTGTIACKCGEVESFHGSVAGWEEMCQSFHERHSGPGHELCDKETAKRIRRQRRNTKRRESTQDAWNTQIRLHINGPGDEL